MDNPLDEVVPADGTPLLPDSESAEDVVRLFRLNVVEGPSIGTSFESSGARCSIGSHESNDLALPDQTVSRFHCEIAQTRYGPRLRDLGSKNGTFVDGLRVYDVVLRDGSLVRAGLSAFRFQATNGEIVLPCSSKDEFGTLVGGSIAMRTTFALFEKAAAADSTVLLEGETGTGKEEAALSIHDAGSRRDRPFMVVDCSALPPDLLESELFGHEKGAFSSADARRLGAFEEAASGTVLLDEIGELSLDLQPKLLRVLERRQIKRIGSNQHQHVDVRVIAATNRDLRSEVNRGRFREDLYYRLAVLKIRMPPLRERAGDVPMLVHRLLDTLGATPEAKERLVTPAFIARLKLAAWPGNVRELRNYLERCLVFEQPLPLAESSSQPSGRAAPAAEDVTLPYEQARKRAIESWETRFIDNLLRAHQGNVERAAQAAGIARAHMYRLVSKHNLLGRHRNQ